MLEDLMVEHCAPTLAGIKTGNLFCCPYASRAEVLTDIKRFEDLLRPKGIGVMALRFFGDRVLVYVYRTSELARDISRKEAWELLHKAGYPCPRVDACLSMLVERLNADKDFPHEIGLFLGYPPEDVRGFIENRGDCCKCTGCWKVYGDERQAKQKFEAYRQCTAAYCRRRRTGASIERLAVAG